MAVWSFQISRKIDAKIEIQKHVIARLKENKRGWQILFELITSCQTHHLKDLKNIIYMLQIHIEVFKLSLHVFGNFGNIP